MTQSEDRLKEEIQNVRQMAENDQLTVERLLPIFDEFFARELLDITSFVFELRARKYIPAKVIDLSLIQWLDNSDFLKRSFAKMHMTIPLSTEAIQQCQKLTENSDLGIVANALELIARDPEASRSVRSQLQAIEEKYRDVDDSRIHEAFKSLNLR